MTDSMDEGLSATNRTARVFIRNNTQHKAVIQIYHNNDSCGTDSAGFFAQPGEEVGPLTVHFRTGFGSYSEKDYWATRLTTFEGDKREVYVNEGGTLENTWKEYQLQGDDSGKDLHFNVNKSNFNIDLPSGGGKVLMKHRHTLSGVSHVFVLMLENRSFDNILGRSGLPGITVASEEDINYYLDQECHIQTGAPAQMTTDPAHEFTDVLEQLTGSRQYKGGKYPPINNSGYAQNYATSTSEGPTPQFSRIGDIMRCFDTEKQLPVIYQLAQEFAVCDHWFSSLPGPTWPNRFFVHGASSVNMDDSPSQGDIALWESIDGFTYPNGSIFDALKQANLPYKIYCDWENKYTNIPEKSSHFGKIPQVSSLKGISISETTDMQYFSADLNSCPYDSVYTFIEPNYGNVTKNFEGGSSQHPMDNTFGGEGLIKDVYEIIRNSPLWYNSLLIITYDEHGGFYDSVNPTHPTPPPGDKASQEYNRHGFNFDQLGARVPAVVISPWIKRGKVIKTTLEHSSVPKTLETVCGLPPLTDRDRWSQTLLDDMDLNMPYPRIDCPQGLPYPYQSPDFEAAPSLSRSNEEIGDQLIPESGNIIGTIGILRKIKQELDDDKDLASTPENEPPIKTYSDAETYAETIIKRIEQERKLAREDYLKNRMPPRDKDRS